MSCWQTDVRNLALQVQPHCTPQGAQNEGASNPSSALRGWLLLKPRCGFGRPHSKTVGHTLEPPGVMGAVSGHSVADGNRWKSAYLKEADIHKGRRLFNFRA